jgi:hypothetical protein
MHFFAVFLLLSFGTMATTMFFHHLFRIARDHWTMTLCLTGVALSWLAGFNMWTGFHVGLRYAWVGTTLTGVALAGTAMLLHALIGFFTGLDVKFHDEAEVMERHELKKVA